MSEQHTAAAPVLDRAADHTTWCAPGSARHRVPLRLAMLGGSLAAGPGPATRHGTPAAQLALGLSAAGGRPVRLTDAAAPGARSRDLGRQVDAVAASGCPDVAVLIVGDDDVAHRCSPEDAVRRLALAVHGLTVLGARVVVGTCPDVGIVGTLAQPLPHLTRRRARALARAQAAAVRVGGGVAVDLGGRPGMVHVLLPAVCQALGLSAAWPIRPHAA
jgi:hypothetical protein